MSYSNCYIQQMCLKLKQLDFLTKIAVIAKAVFVKWPSNGEDSYGDPADKHLSKDHIWMLNILSVLVSFTFMRVLHFITVIRLLDTEGIFKVTSHINP